MKDIYERVGEHHYRVTRGDVPGMNADVEIYATEDILKMIRTDEAPRQIFNVASLPDVMSPVHLMPDAHYGYGFPIGAVAAFDAADGWVSPGGVGADINCGVRLISTSIPVSELDESRRTKLVETLYKRVPCGIGVGGPFRLAGKDMDRVLRLGARAVVDMGHGSEDDLDHTEDGGCMEGVDEIVVSKTARERGWDQCGTLGSGNHFLEVQRVEKVFDEDQAESWGIREGNVAVMIHSGSRGLGYQVFTEFSRRAKSSLRQFGLTVLDGQLSPLPIRSDLGREYLSAMRASANFAFANRQVLMHLTQKALEDFFSETQRSIGFRLVYDVAHNIAKVEEYEQDDRMDKILVHRKGATRAYPSQPVIIPGDMGTASYLLVGSPEARSSYYTVCHGAGRVLSRHAAKKKVNVKNMLDGLRRLGIEVRGASKGGLAEEAPEAYKDIEQVVDAVEANRFVRRVARLKPVCVIKG